MGDGRWAMGLGLALLLALIALTTFNGVTTERFAADLEITRWVQNLEVNETAEEYLFYVVFEGFAGLLVFLTALWL